MDALADLVDKIGLKREHALALLAGALALGPSPTDLAPAAGRRLLLQALRVVAAASFRRPAFAHFGGGFALV